MHVGGEGTLSARAHRVRLRWGCPCVVSAVLLVNAQLWRESWAPAPRRVPGTQSDTAVEDPVLPAGADPVGRRSVEGRNLKQMEPEKHVNVRETVRSRVMGGTAVRSTALACPVAPWSQGRQLWSRLGRGRAGRMGPAATGAATTPGERGVTGWLYAASPCSSGGPAL